MAKWSADLPGSSGHLHQSLCCASGDTNLFFENGGMSPLMRQYIAGLGAFIPELMTMIAPTVNS
jgi:glutamine synthetase